jgi:hypothetical protein
MDTTRITSITLDSLETDIEKVLSNVYSFLNTYKKYENNTYFSSVERENNSVKCYLNNVLRFEFIYKRCSINRINADYALLRVYDVSGNDITRSYVGATAVDNVYYIPFGYLIENIYYFVATTNGLMICHRLLDYEDTSTYIYPFSSVTFVNDNSSLHIVVNREQPVSNIESATEEYSSEFVSLIPTVIGEQPTLGGNETIQSTDKLYSIDGSGTDNLDFIKHVKRLTVGNGSYIVCAKIALKE